MCFGVLSFYIHDTFSYTFFKFDSLSPISSFPAFRGSVGIIIQIEMDSKDKPSLNPPEHSHDDDHRLQTSEAAPPSYNASYPQPDKVTCVFPRSCSILHSSNHTHTHTCCQFTERHRSVRAFGSAASRQGQHRNHVYDGIRPTSRASAPAKRRLQDPLRRLARPGPVSRMPAANGQQDEKCVGRIYIVSLVCSTNLFCFVERESQKLI